MSNLEKREAALEAADHLSESLDGFTRTIESVTTRQRVLQAVLAVVVVTLLSVMYFNYDGAVSRCKTGNELREQIDTKFGSVAEALEATAEGPISPQDRAFLDLLSDELEPRDCSDINLLGR